MISVKLAVMPGGKSKKDLIPFPLQRASEEACARRARALEDLLRAAEADVFDYDQLADLDQ
jgi:hypothetical protein